MDQKCKGTNCDAGPSNGYRHSSECQFDHARAIASGIKRVEVGATVPDHFSYIMWRGQRVELKQPEVTVVSNPTGPSWAQQRFLDAAKQIDASREKPKTVVTPLQCGKCERTIEADAMTGTKCGCTPDISYNDVLAWIRLNPKYWERLKAAQPTQRSANTLWTNTVDSDAVRQCMYRAEADFHRGSKAFLSKREQGHIMEMFRKVVSAFVNNITSPQE